MPDTDNSVLVPQQELTPLDEQVQDGAGSPALAPISPTVSTRSIRRSCGGARTTLQHAINAGHLLITAKAKLDTHGRWLPWLHTHCPQVSERTAQAYMAPCPERSGPDEGKSRSPLRI